MRLKVDLSQAIDPRNAVMIVNFALDFDQQARREASEVRNITSNGMLAAKHEAIWPRAKGLP